VLRLRQMPLMMATYFSVKLFSITDCEVPPTPHPRGKMLRALTRRPQIFD